MSPFLEEKTDSREVKWLVELAGFLPGFPGLVIKNPPASAIDVGSFSGLERSPGERNGNPLQYSYLGNPMDRGAWWATVHGIAELDTTEHMKTSPK